MKAESMPFSKMLNGDPAAREHYHVPKYQREYTWRNAEWDRLLQDIHENEPGYFMGSVICVHDGEPQNPGRDIIYEVVDGQQRLATLSLLMMAILRKLSDLKAEHPFEDEDDRLAFQNALASLRNRMVRKKGDYSPNESGGWVEKNKLCFLRVQPSSQNHNLEDYQYLVGDLGIINAREKPKYLGNRSMAKAYRFFLDAIPSEIKPLLDLVTRINQLNFVHISVSSQADAFKLFETLNNRGIPLSAIDIIKNMMLAAMEKQHQVDIDESYDKWQEFVAAVPDATDQERFLRHFYNAFRWDPAVKVEGIARAVKSKIIDIYEDLIRRGARTLFDSLCENAELYGRLIAPNESGFPAAVRNQLSDLVRINATPAYLVLLYLFSRPAGQFAEPDFLVRVVDLLRRYYVRRNVTDFPGTRDLDQGHIELVEACHKRITGGDKLSVAFFRDQLFTNGRYAPTATFDKALRGGLYDANILMTRYLLVKLDEAHNTREYSPDLWVRNEDGKFVWTVEHVLPQTEAITAEWTAMIAPGDPAEALRLHELHVHRLGNLTLSGYNSKLATAAFDKKQALSENRKFLGQTINIGYRNGLALNSLPFEVNGTPISLATASAWTAATIEARTNKMADLLLKMYAVNGID